MKLIISSILKFACWKLIIHILWGLHNICYHQSMINVSLKYSLWSNSLCLCAFMSCVIIMNYSPYVIFYVKYSMHFSMYYLFLYFTPHVLCTFLHAYSVECQVNLWVLRTTQLHKFFHAWNMFQGAMLDKNL